MLIATAEFQSANIAYFQRKIQLSGFSAYPYVSPSQLIRISGVLTICTIAAWSYNISCMLRDEEILESSANTPQV